MTRCTWVSSATVHAAAANARSVAALTQNPGCTRRRVLDSAGVKAHELAASLEIEIVEGNFTPYDAYNAEEAFLASTSPTILPVQSINGVTITGNGGTGTEFGV